ncbi:hypothetical protein [Bartonella sp. CM120XJJH]|uniref:hypothetical protein n=1 Tax=Bartonella sp. CM120XJJH TaxID=3243544 RepID=UPI0035CFC01A
MVVVRGVAVWLFVGRAGMAVCRACGYGGCKGAGYGCCKGARYGCCRGSGRRM